MSIVWIYAALSVFCSAVKFEEVTAVTNFAKLFPSEAQSPITSVQPDKFNSDNLLVTTRTAVYSVPVEGNDGPKHIAGKPTTDGEYIIANMRGIVIPSSK